MSTVLCLSIIPWVNDTAVPATTSEELTSKENSPALLVASTFVSIRAACPACSGLPAVWLKVTLALPYPSFTVSATAPLPLPAISFPLVE